MGYQQEVPVTTRFLDRDEAGRQLAARRNHAKDGTGVGHGIEL
jgi:hypothetical protein